MQAYSDGRTMKSHGFSVSNKMNVPFRASNLVYSTNYDGTILRYKLKTPFRLLLSPLGCARNLHVSLNTMLDGRFIRLPGIVIVVLYQDKFKFGQNSPCPIALRWMLYFSTRNGAVIRLKKMLDYTIISTQKGENIGLSYLSQSEIRRYYSQGRRRYNQL